MVQPYYAVIKNNVDLNLLTWEDAQNIWSKLSKQGTKIECAEKFTKSIIIKQVTLIKIKTK